MLEIKTPSLIDPRIFITLLFCLFLFACGKQKFKNQDPNIIIILADDLGWTDTGFMGSRYYETPELNKLAGMGMVFTNAYANAPNCAPTRACLLSGQYMPRHGIYTVNSSERGKCADRKIIPTPNRTDLDTSIITLAEVLKKEGYVTASIGKWHLGSVPESGPLIQGFDVNIAGDQAGHPRSYFSPYQIPYLNDGPEGEYLTDRLTSEAVRFIQENSNKSFFLYLPHFAVHTPIQAKPEWINHFAQKTGEGPHMNPEYAAMIKSLDEGIGRIISVLDKLQLKENTLIIFFSDNGPHGAFSGADPLRGSKGMLYEGGIRIPMILSWPGKIKNGTICEAPVIGIDFYPTILELTGIKNSTLKALDGHSLLPLLKGRDRLKRECLYWHFPAYLEKYRGMEEKFRTTPVGAIRKGDWKLIEFFESGKLELYNLKEDISESNDLSKSNPEKTEELHNQLIKWREEIGAPVPRELNPDFVIR